MLFVCFFRFEGRLPMKKGAQTDPVLKISNVISEGVAQADAEGIPQRFGGGEPGGIHMEAEELHAQTQRGIGGLWGIAGSQMEAAACKDHFVPVILQSQA